MKAQIETTESRSEIKTKSLKMNSTRLKKNSTRLNQIRNEIRRSKFVIYNLNEKITVAVSEEMTGTIPPRKPLILSPRN